ncbi:spore coat protein [Paenibacillus radicis (ex Xue et al. 2023)]|uniref:Spore coat protein n=1 Tax=Paenibacillus radicis (ex Xue et al. 2023) TaxID=2972489 RepID=A0ABT1YKF7_9BACL|nr:spore coat protein [Paenibacillus radicis (ex Xue et al. 2023)]MCR8632460.1 spore coat protein [Paenibacillus radicis (ex Xue et al. 2023)]
MYQQTLTNSYNQQSNQTQNTQLKEQDWGNLVLSELKRTAREYTTAALESSHPAIRQTFQTIAQHTMQDQAELFTVLSQLSGYGPIKAADQQEIQQELQQQIQKAEQLQSFVQQSLQSHFAGAGGFQQQQYVNTAFQSSQPYQQSTQAPSYQPYTQSLPAQGSQGQSYGQSYSQGISSTPGFNQNFNQAIHNSGLGFSQNTNTGYSQNQSSGSQSEANDYSGAKSSFTGGQDFSSSSTARIGQASISATANQDYNTNKYSSSADTSFSKNAQDTFSSSTGARGGNSFNWHGSDENENTLTSASSQNQNRSAESTGKSFI